MGNPSSVVSRRRSPRRRKQLNGRMVKGVFCFVLVVAFTALSTALPFDPAPRFVCAPPWTLLSTGCYRFHEYPMTQSEAKKFCEEEQEFPARLIEIDSAEENRAINAEMQRQNTFSRKINFWLGITDRHFEGHWLLESTGKSVNFTNWNSGEPNNGNGSPGGENCAFINELEGWNDVDCNGKPSNGWMRTALCEMQIFWQDTYLYSNNQQPAKQKFPSQNRLSLEPINWENKKTANTSLQSFNLSYPEIWQNSTSALIPSVSLQSSVSFKSVLHICEWWTRGKWSSLMTREETLL